MEKQALRAIQEKIDSIEKRIKNPKINLKYIKLKQLQKQAYIVYAEDVITELENKSILTPEQQRRLKSCKEFLQKEKK